MLLLLLGKNPYTGPNTAYASGIDALLSGEIDLSAVSLACVLVDTALYVPDFDTDNNLDDIASAARISTSSNLTSVAVSNGVLTASSPTFTAVTGATVEAMVLYVNTGDPTTSTLLAFYNECDVFPYTPSGADLTVNWTGGGRVIILSDEEDYPWVRSVGLNAQSAGSGVSVVIPAPDYVEEGDLLITVISLRSGSVTTLSGWSEILPSAAGADTEAGLNMFYKVATASEPADYTWVITGGTDRMGAMFSIANTDGTVNDATAGSTGTTVNAPEVTPGSPRGLYVATIAANTGSNTNYPSEIWTNASKVMGHRADSGLGRLGVGAAVALCDKGAAETTLGVVCTSAFSLDRLVAFAVVAP